MDGQMKRCRPPLEGQSNSYLMDPLALQGAVRIQSSCYSTCKHTWESASREGRRLVFTQMQANVSTCMRGSPALALLAVGVIAGSVVERQPQRQAGDGGVDGLVQHLEDLGIRGVLHQALRVNPLSAVHIPSICAESLARESSYSCTGQDIVIAHVRNMCLLICAWLSAACAALVSCATELRP